MSSDDIVLTWAPNLRGNAPSTFVLTGERHYFWSLAHYGVVTGTGISTSEEDADAYTQIRLPIERWLREFRLKVAPTGQNGLPGNTSAADITVSFRVRGPDPADVTTDIRTITIGGAVTGELSVTPLFSPHIAAGSLLNGKVDTNLTGGERVIIPIVLVWLGAFYTVFPGWFAVSSASFSESRARSPPSEMPSESAPRVSPMSSPLGMAGTSIPDTDLMMWKVGTCDCMMAVNKKWTELRFLRPCKYHESLHTSEKDVHAEHKETNRKSVDNPKVLEEFMKKVKGFNMGKIERQ